MDGPMRNLREKFKDASAKYSDKTAIQYKKDDEWCEISHAVFRDNVESLSSFLLKEGVKNRDKIAILLDNRPEWPLVFFAAVSIGAVSVPIDPESSPEEIENILRHSGCKIVYTGGGAILDKILASNAASSAKIISVDSDEFKNALNFERMSDVEEEIFPSDLACILYTSGTTDEAKGVMLSHENLVSNSESLDRLALFKHGESVISILPLHHTYPLMITLILPLLYGGRIIYPGTIRAEALFKAMKETNPVFFVGVPQIFHLFYQHTRERLRKIPWPLSVFFDILIDCLYAVRNKTGINLSRFLLWGLHRRFGSRLRLFINGGAKLNEDAEKSLIKFGFTLVNGYGLTETSPVLTLTPVKKPKIGSAGLPIPGVEVRIEGKDESGSGEVIARGPNIMKGYYKRDDLTAQVMRDGWFHTGDLGYIDEDGYLFLTGRSKELIVLSSGLNINAEEIEEAYLKHTPAKEMCVFEVPDRKGREDGLMLWAVLVPDLEVFKKYGEVNLRAVIKERLDNVSRNLSPHKRIKGFSITLKKLPRTPLGKIKRFVVKDMYMPEIAREKGAFGAKELSREDLELMEENAAQKIINYLKKETKVKDIVPGDSLELDLGVDSLGRIELASGLEKVFNTKIEDEIIGKSFTVRDLIIGIRSLPKEGGEAPGTREEKVVDESDYWKSIFQVLPKKENLEKIDLKPGLGSWLAGFFFISFHYMLFKIFYDLKVEGRGNFPKRGPYILYANHTSYFDGFLIAASLPRFPRLDLFFLGFRAYLTVPIIRNLIKIGRVVPIDFSSHLLDALRSCYYVLKNGKSLCIFPEGLRTLDGNINEFKRGFGILVKEAEPVSVVPIILEGSFEAWPRTSKFPKRHPIKVRYGEALTPEELEKKGFSMGAKDSYEAICIAARDTLINLKKK
jgi:long-chain acyl-CoA synthetase